MKHLWAFILPLAMLLSACSTPAVVAPQAKAPASAAPVAVKPNVLTVYAAASLTEAFSEIGKSFEATNPGVTVTFNFAGSQTLRTQIEQGAQADVFASANTKEMDALVTSKFVAAATPKSLLTNQLVIIMPANNPAGLTQAADLSKSGLRLVLAAEEVPVGAYSLQVLDKLDQALGGRYKDKVLDNVVSYENDVKQVVAKVQLGEADAGIVYSSDRAAAPDLRAIDIPAENNVVAKYPIAALTNSKNPELARAFIAYALSAPGQSILKKWGFLPAQ